MIAAVTTFISGRRWRLRATMLLCADADGLAVFTVIGFGTGLQVTKSYSIVIVTGAA